MLRCRTVRFLRQRRKLPEPVLDLRSRYQRIGPQIACGWRRQGGRSLPRVLAQCCVAFANTASEPMDAEQARNDSAEFDRPSVGEPDSSLRLHRSDSHEESYLVASLEPDSTLDRAETIRESEEAGSASYGVRSESGHGEDSQLSQPGTSGEASSL